MATAQLGTVLHHLRSLIDLRGTADLTDAELLERFARRHEEAAFASLLKRYGPLVLGVCRRVLGDAHDAEDAFQATFLVLVRKAAALGGCESLGYWLYTVAYRTAARARTSAARRRRHERQAGAMSDADPLADLAWRDLRPLL